MRKDKENHHTTTRIDRLKKAVQTAKPGVCTQRAVIWTQYFRTRKNRGKSIFIQMAEALREVLLQKSITIYPDELIVGNFSSKRVGGSIYPELHGLVVMQDIFKFSSRPTSPLEISSHEIRQLLKIMPFWLFRFLGIRAHKTLSQKIRLLADQLKAHYYLINEGGGIAHLAPDYEKLVTLGTEGITVQVNRSQGNFEPGSREWIFLEAVKIIAEALARFGDRYAGLALAMAETETDPMRKEELLEVMDELRMRQPNFHARIHKNAPKAYLEKVYHTLCSGSNSPALYNDDIIVETMKKNGYASEDARDYTAVGCVEPVSQGKSFASTDAALFNVPIMLELALNRGKRFSSNIRKGKKTMPVSQMTSMTDVKKAFEIQLEYGIQKLLRDLRAVEIANAVYHPTPFTSMLLEGCLEKGVCSTAGGAAYNFSGIQCVGPVDTGDALYAIERAVFIEKRITLPHLVAMLKKNIPDQGWRSYLRNLPKFGNDNEAVDKYVLYVIDTFARMIESHTNTRGGKYTVGLYSVTAHRYYGDITGALPNGRGKGESFASGIAPANGMDKNGPTAMLNSVNRIDFTRFANGINLNIKFEPALIKGAIGGHALESLLGTYFRRGGMQVQLNILDPVALIEARDNPDAYPHLLVRVSGYSAYFNDLTPRMKDELIHRTLMACGSF